MHALAVASGVRTPEIRTHTKAFGRLFVFALLFVLPLLST